MPPDIGLMLSGRVVYMFYIFFLLPSLIYTLLRNSMEGRGTGEDRKGRLLGSGAECFETDGRRGQLSVAVDIPVVLSANRNQVPGQM